MNSMIRQKIYGEKYFAPHGFDVEFASTPDDQGGTEFTLTTALASQLRPGTHTPWWREARRVRCPAQDTWKQLFGFRWDSNPQTTHEFSTLWSKWGLQ
jgi:hypothetical protein